MKEIDDMLTEELTPNKVDQDYNARSYATLVNKRFASLNSKDDKSISTTKAKSPPLRLPLKISKPNPNKPTKSLDEVM